MTDCSTTEMVRELLMRELALTGKTWNEKTGKWEKGKERIL